MPSTADSSTCTRAALLFIAATLALGLFVSTLAQTQFQAFQLAFLTMLPSILLSGFMFPFEGMPEAAQWIAQVLPLTHFNVIIRGIMLRGAPCTDWASRPRSSAVFLVVALGDRDAALPQATGLMAGKAGMAATPAQTSDERAATRARRRSRRAACVHSPMRARACSSSALCPGRRRWPRGSTTRSRRTRSGA